MRIERFYEDNKVAFIVLGRGIHLDLGIYHGEMSGVAVIATRFCLGVRLGTNFWGLSFNN